MLLVALLGWLGTTVAGAVSPQNRSATLAFLQARYAYERALAAHAPALTAAAEGAAGALAAECPGALAGAPQSARERLGETSLASPPPRQVGEENRQSRQLSAVEGEAFLAVALQAIDRPAALAFTRAVRPLRWSSAAVTALEQGQTAILEWELSLPPPAACADMRAWAASGYRTLAPATKSLIAGQQAAVQPLRRAVRLEAADLAEPLRRYEGPQARALARKIDALQGESESALASLAGADERLQRALGLPSEAHAHEGPPKGSVEIGHGRTQAGGRYSVWVEPRQSAALAGCAVSLAVYEKEESRSANGVIVIIGSGSSSSCLTRAHPSPPSAECHGDGLVAIEGQTSPEAHRVRLRLADGTQITSSVAVVPARLGGPLGFYYQVVRESARPVSLTELGARGRVLRTLKLGRPLHCRVQPPKLLARRVIASGSAHGTSFSIIGERQRFRGRSEFELQIEVEAQQADVIESGGEPSFRPGPFAVRIKTGCEPGEFAILYGILRAPADAVLVRVSGALVPLQRAAIPRALKKRGVLAYIGLPALATELIVRSRAGKTVFRESLASRATELRETCEGEAEGDA